MQIRPVISVSSKNAMRYIYAFSLSNGSLTRLKCPTSFLELVVGIVMIVTKEKQNEGCTTGKLNILIKAIIKWYLSYVSSRRSHQVNWSQPGADE